MLKQQRPLALVSSRVFFDGTLWASHAPIAADTISYSITEGIRATVSEWNTLTLRREKRFKVGANGSHFWLFQGLLLR